VFIYFDKNGNIKNLVRKGHLDNTLTPASPSMR